MPTSSSTSTQLWPNDRPARQHWGRLAIGLTGGIGSGKSTVSHLFAAKGASIIDTDAIAHALTACNGAAMAEIARQFGAQFVQTDGALDRAKMRAQVFAHPQEKRKLEAILHPMIAERCSMAAHQATGCYLIFDVPLLVESGHWRERVDRVLIVDCPLEMQINRVMQRNQLSREQVLAIIAAQASREQRLAVADDVISNHADLQSLAYQVDQLHAFYMKSL